MNRSDDRRITLVFIIALACAVLVLTFLNEKPTATLSSTARDVSVVRAPVAESGTSTVAGPTVRGSAAIGDVEVRLRKEVAVKLPGTVSTSVECHGVSCMATCVVDLNNPQEIQALPRAGSDWLSDALLAAGAKANGELETEITGGNQIIYKHAFTY